MNFFKSFKNSCWLFDNLLFAIVFNYYLPSTAYEVAEEKGQAEFDCLATKEVAGRERL